MKHLCSCDWLISDSIMSPSFIYVAANNGISFFFETEYCYIVFVYQIFFFHSSVNRHLGYLHILTVANNATMNMMVKLFIWDPGFNYCENKFRSGIAGSYDSLFLIFQGTSIIISIVPHHSTFPLMVYKVSGCSKWLIFCPFDSDHPNEFEVISHSSFDLHFPDG